MPKTSKKGKKSSKGKTDKTVIKTKITKTVKKVDEPVETPEVVAPVESDSSIEMEQGKTKKEKLAKATEKDVDSKPVVKSKLLKSSNRAKRFRKLEKITAQHRLQRGVIYLGHIPYGFFEEQIREFFSQFGNVTRVKLARSKKTARSKGYAFIEFDDLETAAIAADTMNNRFMFDRRLVCHVVEDEDIHKDLFKYCDKKWKFIPHQKINTNKLNSEKSDEKKYEKVKRLLEQEQVKRERIKEFGIKYNFPGYQAVINAASQQAGDDE